MKRTTIMLPPDLKARAEKRARRLRVSLGQLIRKSLEAGLREMAPLRDEDPLFTDDAVFEGRTPRDLARDHDRYLYGDRP